VRSVVSKLAGLLFALGCLAAEPSWAQCVEGTPDAAGRTPVVCDGDASAGFEARLDTDDFDVTINVGATVKDGNGSEAILINGNSSVINGTYQTTDPVGVVPGGAIVIENVGAAGMRVEASKTGSYLQNEGAITGGVPLLAVDGTVGMQVGDGNAVMNGVNGSITLYGDSATGIEAGSNSSVDVTDAAGLNLASPSLSGQATKTVENHGVIEIHGENGRGIVVGDDTNRLDSGMNFGVWNSFEGTSAASILVTDGDGGIGILVGGSSGVVNQGSVTVEGNDGKGIVLGDLSTLTNDGTVTATGVDSLGIDAGDGIKINNTVTGEIHGGSGLEGYAIRFQEVDGDDMGTNVLGNDGLIDTLGTVAIEGSAGRDQINLNDGSTVIGDIRLNDGADTIILHGTATLTGDVFLGQDQDLPFPQVNFFVMTGDGGVYDGDVIGGAGADQLFITDTATFTGNFFGNGNADTVELRAGSTSAATFDLGTGADQFTLQSMVTFTGILMTGAGNDQIELLADSVFTPAALVELGNGDDTFFVGDLATVVGDLETGAGSDGVFLGTKDTTVGGASYTGTIDLGVSEDDADALNVVTLDLDATLDGDLVAGMGQDNILFLDGSLLTGNVTLGDGDDFLIHFDDGAASIDGSVDLGPGADTLDLRFNLSVTGTIDMGDGDDVFRIRPGEGIPGNLIPGPGDDILHLVSFAGEAPGTVELGIASDFEALRIGPNDKSRAFAWTIETTAPRTFTGGVVLQSGDLMFDGIVELAADFTQEPESTMVFELEQVVEDSMLAVTGTLTLEVGAALEIKFAGEILADSYTLIRTNGGITGSFDSEIFPDFATFDFFTELVGNDFILNVTRSGFYDDFARTSSEERVADYLDEAIFRSGTDALPETKVALGVLDAGELATALGQLHPEIYDAHTSSILSWGRMQQRVLQERPMHCERFRYAPRPEIVSESPCGTRSFQPWAKVVGQLGRHSGGEPKGYDTRGGGVLLGIDHRWKDDIWFSGDIGFAHLDIESDNGADGGFDSVDLGAAAGMVRGALRLRTSMTYSHGFHETTRELDFLADRVKGKFDSDRITLAAGAGYQFHLGHFIVEPNATIDYSHVEEESLNETGHDEVALDVSSRKTDLFATTTGVRFSTNFLKYRYAGKYLEWADGVWSPAVSVQWRQLVGDVDRDQKATMRGVPGSLGSFKSKADDSDGGVEVGGHITFQPLKSAATLEIGYDGYFGDDVTDHALKATVRIPF